MRPWEGSTLYSRRVESRSSIQLLLNNARCGCSDNIKMKQDILEQRVLQRNVNSARLCCVYLLTTFCILCLSYVRRGECICFLIIVMYTKMINGKPICTGRSAKGMQTNLDRSDQRCCQCTSLSDNAETWWWRQLYWR